MMDFHSEAHKQAIIDSMADNSMAVFANVSGSRIYGKIRGMPVHDVGLMFGSLIGSIQRHMAETGKRIQDSGGPIDEFIDGYEQGLTQPPVHEGTRIKDLPNSENENG